MNGSATSFIRKGAKDTPRSASGMRIASTAIGLRYADRIYRKLYHSRYIHPPQGFDFLTYFEFPEDLAEDFRALLSNLRDPELNPEWAFVKREIEIWLRKR